MGSGMLEIEPQTPSTKHQSITYTEAYPPWGDKVSMLTHTCPHKPLRKIKMATCNYQADSPICLWPDV